MVKQPVPRALRRRVSQLYAEGFSKRRISLLEGVSRYKIDRIISNVTEKTIEKHAENKGTVLREQRELRKSITHPEKQTEKLNEILKMEPKKAKKLVSSIREEIRQPLSIPKQTKKSAKPNEKIAKKPLTAQERAELDRITEEKIRKINDEIAFFDELIKILNERKKQQPIPEPQPEEKPAEEPEYEEIGEEIIEPEPEKEQYQIVINGVVRQTNSRKYTVLDDVNLLTDEPVDWQEIRNWINSLGYEIARTKALRDSGMHDIDIGIVKGSQYVSRDTIVTDNWKLSLKDVIDMHSFHKAHSGNYYRKKQKNLGSYVSNPDYKNEFEKRGGI